MSADPALLQAHIDALVPSTQVSVTYIAHKDAVTATNRAAGTTSGWVNAITDTYVALRTTAPKGGATSASIPLNAITIVQAAGGWRNLG